MLSIDIRKIMSYTQTMKIVHRQDTTERQHYLIDKKNTYGLTPRLLYVGEVKRKKDWKESPHSHDFIEILLIKSGQGTVIVNEVSYNVQKGDVIIYNANTVHCEISSPSDPFAFSFVACDNVQVVGLSPNQIVAEDQTPIFASKESERYFTNLFSILLNELINKDYYYDEIAENTLKSLVALIFRQLDKNRSVQSATKMSVLYASIIAYINEHFTEKLTLDSIAAATYSSKYHVSHVFSQYNDKYTVFEYINKQRFDYAVNLLKDTDLPIKTVAEKAGFTDSNYFCRFFKSQTGKTPSSLRSGDNTANDN